MGQHYRHPLRERLSQLQQLRVQQLRRRRHLQRALELEPEAEWAAVVRRELDKLTPPPDSVPAPAADPGP